MAGGRFGRRYPRGDAEAQGKPCRWTSDLLRHFSTSGASAGVTSLSSADSFPQSARRKGGFDGAWLESAVDHAVAAIGVSAARTIPPPVRGVQQFLKSGARPFLQQVAGTLPPEDVVRRVAPRGQSRWRRPWRNSRKSGVWLNRQDRLRLTSNWRNRCAVCSRIRKCCWFGAFT